MLKCFIACAFGKSDVDKVYNQGIKKVLKDNKIEALRVDQIEHNDNIDQKIIELIKECDFCIADLTYARPSAYYEAGYVSGLGKNVIYITRSDHFKSKTNDEYGNFKIHFDIQTKNIISWDLQKPLSIFQERLRNRIQLVCKPLLEKEKVSNEYLAQKTEYSSLSIDSRIEKIRIEVLSYLAKKRYKHCYDNMDLNRKQYAAYSINSSKKIIIKFKVTSSATMSYLNNLNKLLSKPEIELMEKGYRYHLFIISLRKIPLTRIEDAFPDAKNIVTGKIIESKWRFSEFMYQLHFVFGYLTLGEFINEFIKQLKDISSELTKT